MFSPEMMQAAQGMMANMKPEDMKRMSDMAANMDPKTMESMMKNMGGAPPGMDSKQMCEQMKNMTPEQMRAGMNQAQGQMGAQKQYVYNGALQLKNEGNSHIKSEAYSKALESYDRAIENLRPHAGDDVKQLRLQLLSNAALCHLKLNDFKKAHEVCEEALSVDSKAVKPLYRRGLSHEGLGDHSQALLDVKNASNLSPDDKAISNELARLRKICSEKGIKEEDLKPKASASAPATAGAPQALRPGSSSSSPSSGDMSQALEQISKNPEMLEQAADMMKNMSPEDIARMMPPGTDPATVKDRLKNPDMMKTAMESLKGMSEEDRKKLLEASSSGKMPGPGGMPDMSNMSAIFENPDMMKQVAEMAKHQGGEDGEQAEMMAKAAEQISSNPELGKQMSNMLKNMPPEQMQKMMEMSAKMRGGGMGQNSGGDSGDDSADMMSPEAASDFMNNPDMMKMAEEMMSNMSPEALAGMAQSSGLDEGKAQMLSKMMPYMKYIMRCMRMMAYVKQGFKAMFSSKGKVVIAVVVLTAAVVQHYRS